MKKLLLSFAAALMGMSAMAQAAVYTLTFDYQKNSKAVSGYLATTTFSVEDNVMTFNMAAFNNNNNGGGQTNSAGGAQIWEFVRCGRKNNASVATITTGSAASSVINSVVINAKKNKSGANDKATTAELLVADNADFTGAHSYTFDVNSLTSDNADITVPVTVAAANMYYQIKIDMPSNTNNGWLQINKVTFYSNTAVAKDPAGLSFPEASYTIKYGEKFTAPDLTKATDGAITWESSKPEVATVDESGAVTILAMGTTEITATAAETDSYYAGTASYTLNVIDPDTFWAPECKDKTNSEFTFTALTGDFQPWSVDDRYGLKATAYVPSTKTSNASDAVAASPVLDFTGYVAPMTLKYRSALNQFKINDVLIDCTDDAVASYVSVVAKVEGSTEWVKIGSVNAPEEFGWDFYDATPIDLAQFAGKKVQIGFRYVSTTECAGTWEVDNVVVLARAKGAAVDNIITDAADAPVEYYNLQGIRVANPDNGIYIRRQGNKVTKVLVK